MSPLARPTASLGVFRGSRCAPSQMLACATLATALLPARPQAVRRGAVQVSAKVSGDSTRVQRAVRVRAAPPSHTASTAWRVRAESDHWMSWSDLLACARNVCDSTSPEPKTPPLAVGSLVESAPGEPTHQLKCTEGEPNGVMTMHSCGLATQQLLARRPRCALLPRQVRRVQLRWRCCVGRKGHGLRETRRAWTCC
jgi:hypothetical protein